VSVDERIANWANSLLWSGGGAGGSCASIEGQWRSPQRWDAIPSGGIPSFDPFDAAIVESAVTILPIFDHALLRAWFVRQGYMAEYMRSKRGALGVAAAASGRPVPQRYEFETLLDEAKGRLAEVLKWPSVVRKERARQIVRETLARMG
jgi:hypothetical protein